METASRTPRETALTVARNAVPELREALALMRVQGDVDTGDIVNGHGTVTIVLRSGEAYELARWARTHATEDERLLHTATRQAC